MVIVDRWSRRVFAIPCHATHTAQKAAELFYEEICLHMCRGIPVWLQMDRDPRFTSAWFKEFFRLTVLRSRLRVPMMVWCGVYGRSTPKAPPRAARVCPAFALPSGSRGTQLRICWNVGLY
jgi:hypothetical protein